MKRLVGTTSALLALLLALVFSASALGTIFVQHNGHPVRPVFDRWAAQSQVPLVPGVVQLWPASLCGGADGCSEYYTDTHPKAAIMHVSGRYTFYFEMGHLFDSEVLTWQTRGTLAHIWGVYGSHWNDSWKALSLGLEDGLTADFAAAYAACAEGQGFGGLQSGFAASIQMRSTCDYIRSLR